MQRRTALLENLGWNFPLGGGTLVAARVCSTGLAGHDNRFFFIWRNVFGGEGLEDYRDSAEGSQNSDCNHRHNGKRKYQSAQ